MATFYAPSDPNLIGTQALPFFQTCIDVVAQVAIMSGQSEEAVRRHLLEHTLHFDAIVRILNQTFELQDPAPPAAMYAGGPTGATGTAASEPEVEYDTAHDPAHGIFNPYRGEEDTRPAEFIAAMRRTPSGIPGVDREAEYYLFYQYKRPQDHDGGNASG
jgi:hypothetical protein